MKKLSEKRIGSGFTGLAISVLKVGVLVLVFTVVGYLSFLDAGVPQKINYQGQLLDSSSKPVADGNYNILFSIYNLEAGGLALWSETQSVSTKKGLFNAILGSVNSITLPFDQDYWLGVKVGVDSEMSPRHKLVSASYSFRAEKANDADKFNSQSASYYLNTSTSFSGDVTGAYNATVVGDDSHNHADSTITDNISINNGRLYAPSGAGNVGIGTAGPPGQKLTVAGTIESTSGGIKFPDGSVQAKAAIGDSGQFIVIGMIPLITTPVSVASTNDTDIAFFDKRDWRLGSPSLKGGTIKYKFVISMSNAVHGGYASIYNYDPGSYTYSKVIEVGNFNFDSLFSVAYMSGDFSLNDLNSFSQSHKLKARVSVAGETLTLNSAYLLIVAKIN